MGYFQRLSAKKLLPKVPVISASPMIRHPVSETDPSHMYELKEIQDKGKHTEAALRVFRIPEEKMVIMGDSGGTDRILSGVKDIGPISWEVWQSPL